MIAWSLAKRPAERMLFQVSRVQSKRLHDYPGSLVMNTALKGAINYLNQNIKMIIINVKNMADLLPRYPDYWIVGVERQPEFEY